MYNFGLSEQHLPLEQAQEQCCLAVYHMPSAPAVHYSRVFVGGGLSYLPEFNCPKPMP